MQPWDSWIKDSTVKNGVSSVEDSGIQKTTISGNTDGAYRSTPPNIRPIGWGKKYEDNWYKTNMPPS
jgi:hypothetical protein